MSPRAHDLLKRLDEYKWDPKRSGEFDLGIFSEEIEEIEEIGIPELLIAIIETRSQVLRWFVSLCDTWKDLSYKNWFRVIRGLPNELVYFRQFGAVATRLLAFDCVKLLLTESDIPIAGRAYTYALRDAGNPPPDFEISRSRLIDIDCHAMWRRLKAEGAPIRDEIDLSSNGGQDIALDHTNDH